MPDPQVFARSKSPLRWIVPLTMFVVIIGGLAWVAQNMPKWRQKAEGPAGPQGEEAHLLVLHARDRTGAAVAIWEMMTEEEINNAKSEQLYAREFEFGAEGHYYFPFLTNPKHNVEIGLESKSCDCARIEVAVMDPAMAEAYVVGRKKDLNFEPPGASSLDWKPLEKSDERGVVLAADSRCLLRVAWTNRKSPGESLRLTTFLWARQPRAAARQHFGFKVDAVSVHPVRMQNDRVSVGLLGPGDASSTEFVVWSPTRAEDQLTVQERIKSGLFDLKVTKLDAADCVALQKKLRSENINTRVLSAWRVTAKVHEQRGAKQMDQGHFLRALELQLPGAAADLPPLLVSGQVTGPVDIGGEDQGKINLKSFAAKHGTKKKILLWTADRQAELEVSQVQPTTIKVKVTKDREGPVGAKQRWNLEVEVPPDQQLSDESAITLQLKKSDPPRRIRIPIVGHAVQG